MIHAPHRLPYLGDVYAGRPAPLEYWPIVRFEEIHLLRPPKQGERLAICKVVGNSLAEQNIVDGDFVIFLMTNKARPGDLVIADTPFGTTLKYFHPTEDRVFLRGASSREHDQVWSLDEIIIRGVVTETRRLIRA